MTVDALAGPLGPQSIIFHGARTHRCVPSSVCITIAAALRYKQTIYNEGMSIDYETRIFSTRAVVVDIVAVFFGFCVRLRSIQSYSCRSVMCVASGEKT